MRIAKPRGLAVLRGGFLGYLEKWIVLIGNRAHHHENIGVTANRFDLRAESNIVSDVSIWI